MRVGFLAAFAAILLLATPVRAGTEDSQEGYYYPKPKVVETYMARVATLADSDRSRRIGFAAALAKDIADKPYPPAFYIFAKGDEADKLIIVGVTDGGLSTVYRTRALLAHLTASARLTQFFQQNAIAEYATFFDFLKLLGFKQITLTDGVAFAHQIKIE